MTSSAPDPVLLLAAHARVSVTTARKAVVLGPSAISVRRCREDILVAAAQLGINLGSHPVADEEPEPREPATIVRTSSVEIRTRRAARLKRSQSTATEPKG